MADWVTISAIASAGGTLVLAAATFSSVKSANRAARVAEQSLLVGLRPLLLPSKLDDPTQKVNFMDDRYLVVPGGQGAADVGPEAVYLAMSLRNVGSDIAVLHGWRFYPERQVGGDMQPTPVDEFTRLTRDLYVPSGDVGFCRARSATRPRPSSPRPPQPSARARRSWSTSSTATTRAASG